MSMFLASAAPALALLLGIPAAYALSRYELPLARDRARRRVRRRSSCPASSSAWRCCAIWSSRPASTSSLALFLAHTALVVPYAVRVVSASLNNLRSDIEEAAVLLGPSRAGAFFRVVMPNIRSGILAAFILGFVTSFNQVPVSLFLSGPGVSHAADRHALLHGNHLRPVGGRPFGAARLHVHRHRVPCRTLPGIVPLCLTPFLSLEKLTLAYGDTGRGRTTRPVDPAAASWWRCSAPPAAARPRRCARSPGCWRRPSGGISLDGARHHPGCRPTSATSGWCSSPTRCSRI